MANEIPHLILHHPSTLTTPELLNETKKLSPASSQTLVEHLFFHTGNSTSAECRLTSKSAPILVTVLLLRGRTPPTQSGFKKRKNLTGCCVIPPRCSPKTTGVKARRRELSAATQCLIIKELPQQGHGLLGSQPGPSRTRLKILSYILKVSSLSRTDEALKEGGKRKFGDEDLSSFELVPASRF